jgi:hypothetical protein
MIENWLQSRLNELEMTHEQFVKRLAEHQIVRSRVTITNWVNGTPISLFTSPEDTKKLADALEWHVDEMLLAAGFDIRPSAISIPMELLPHVRFYKRLRKYQQSRYLEAIRFVSNMFRQFRDDGLNDREEH